jgi:hypothetical protein
MAQCIGIKKDDYAKTIDNVNTKSEAQSTTLRKSKPSEPGSGWIY